MLETSRRARRMERHHKLRKQPPLNLVSLMDIFTILVFFLLVNSSSTQQLPNNSALTLPTSVATKVPDETIVVVITKSDILVQGRKVASIAEVLADSSDSIPALKEELEFQASKEMQDATDENIAAKAITIMGDENISYDLIRRILTSCQQASYTKIAFAANQIARKAAKE
ncbi:ExbD/TolR family protein [Teredinibacter haidensis]|uniref:ExbD/TolR family protein n=1 Tax=Teredinibacter haidensis TaxID=2731755 RepID=UPI0009F9005B|nr:biopolymer transporter ExbD [Teredinibacter haidensis]